MTLFTSLYTGVNGMNAQSKSTATISTNIANMTTVGYKKSETMFHDLVVNNTKPSRFANGGVLTTNVQRIDKQGALQQTSFKTDMGISGDGFFAVKTQDDPAMEFLYTRNGTFSPDAEGVMRNAVGFILYGWPVDLNGNVMSGPTTASLQAVDVNEFDSQFRATTSGNLYANLNGAQESTSLLTMFNGTLPAAHQSTWDPLTETSTDNSTAAHFVRNLTVYDNAGIPRELSFEYRKITGPMAQGISRTTGVNHLTSLTDPAVFGNIAAGDSFSITTTDPLGANVTQEYIIGVAGGPLQVQVNTVGDLTNHINSTFGGGNAVDASIDSEGRLVFKAINLEADLDFLNTSGTPLGTPPVPLFTGGTLNLVSLNNSPLIADVNANSAAYTYQEGFPEIDVDDTNTNGWWEVRVLAETDPSVFPEFIPDPNYDPDVVPPMDPMMINPLWIQDPGDLATPITYGQKQEVAKGLINFDGRGRLNTPRLPDVNGVADEGPVVDGRVTLNIANFDSNAELYNGLVSEGLTNVQIDLSRTTQFAGGYNVITASQNGFEAGTLTGVNITTDGMVVASFTNGQTQNIYQIPLADFINPNGLLAMSGTVFAQTSDAGELTMLEAGTGGAGLIQASTIETSNVDLADEFAHLIVSQRAFSANSRVVNTVDEMTQMLRQLKS